MRVLMISIDKGLLGKGQLGDVVERHREYGRHVDQLDIIVFSKKGFEKYQISENVMAYPTNSCCKLKYTCDAKKLGKKLFEKNKYDLIVTQEPFLTGLVGVSLKKKFGSKLLVHFHGDFAGLFLLFAKLFILPKADGIRVMSQGQKEKLIEKGIKENKIRVISTPINLEKYFAVSGFDFAHQSQSRVLHVGRDDKVKDYNTLVQAFLLVAKKFSKAAFFQVGVGDKFKRYNRWVNKLNKDPNLKSSFNFTIVHVPQQRQDTLINDFYSEAYLVVLSSTSESFGKVLVEANACGKPVVSTATTGAKEIIQDGYNGFLVPIGDYQALADKIIYLLDNPQKAQEMGENGRKLVNERFGNNTEKIINFWQELLKQ